MIPPSVHPYTVEQPPKSRQRWCASHPNVHAVALVVLHRDDGSAATSIPACQGCCDRITEAQAHREARRARRVPCQTPGTVTPQHGRV